VLVTVNAVPHDTRADCAVALRDGPLTVGVVWRSDEQAVTVMVGEEPPGNADGDSRVPRLGEANVFGDLRGYVIGADAARLLEESSVRKQTHKQTHKQRGAVLSASMAIDSLAVAAFPVLSAAALDALAVLRLAAAGLR
jgi:hypothetical protein